MDYTITVTSTEEKALSTIAVDRVDWITNFTKERARIAKEEIINKLVAHCNANEIALAVGESAQVDQAFDLGIATAATSGEVTEGP